MTDLDPNGHPVTVGRIQLVTPGLRGAADWHPPGSAGMRGAELTTADLDRALSDADVASQGSVVIGSAREIAAPAALPTRGTTFGEPAIQMRVPAPNEEYGQFVLVADEAGVTTWNFARDEHDAVVTRGGADRVYVIRRYVPPAPQIAGSRGLFGAIGTKILKVLVFPLVDQALGRVGDFFVKRWEEHNRPYGIRTFTPDDFTSAGTQIEGAMWDDLSDEPALLLVHGTFSTARGGFGGFPKDYVADLHAMYGGRVFAFDHPTLSEDPRQNAEWFMSKVPDGKQFRLDIVCHSRGGLVSRALAEKTSELGGGSKDVRVGKIVFAAAPNDGTPLTDTKYMGDFIDTYTNLLNFFPDIGVLDVLQAIIAVVKQLAVATVAGLAGLESMVKTGDFLHEWLNTGVRDGKRYFALASDYEPTDPGLASFAKDRLMDAIFDAPNDLVVPTLSVTEQNGSGFFPIDDHLAFGHADGIMHSGYFANQTARTKILEWLST